MRKAEGLSFPQVPRSSEQWFQRYHLKSTMYKPSEIAQFTCLEQCVSISLFLQLACLWGVEPFVGFEATSSNIAHSRNLDFRTTFRTLVKVKAPLQGSGFGFAVWHILRFCASAQGKCQKQNFVIRTTKGLTHSVFDRIAFPAISSDMRRSNGFMKFVDKQHFVVSTLQVNGPNGTTVSLRCMKRQISMAHCTSFADHTKLSLIEAQSQSSCFSRCTNLRNTVC